MFVGMRGLITLNDCLRYSLALGEILATICSLLIPIPLELVGEIVGSIIIDWITVGNMELDCLHAHGMSYYIQDKYIKSADDFQVHLCDNCHTIAHVNEEQELMNCNGCGNKSDFSKISLPYSSKLLFYEMMGMGVQTKFKV